MTTRAGRINLAMALTMHSFSAHEAADCRDSIDNVFARRFERLALLSKSLLHFSTPADGMCRVMVAERWLTAAVCADTVDLYA